MSHVASPNVEPCVWMAAGLVSYKLCDREFDCTHCPLDLALRGGGAPAEETFVTAGSRRSHGFPDDRRYASGHTWVATGCRRGEPTVRVGVDGFAAALLPRPVGVVPVSGPSELARGDVICDIELPEGIFSIRAPVSGRLERENPDLHQQPGLVVESPYHNGWLVELTPSADVAAPGRLFDATEARERSALHLRRFRRRVAHQLLADVASVGPCMADGGEALTSLSDILGEARYLEILREVLR